MAKKPSDFAVAVLLNKGKKDAAKAAPDEGGDEEGGGGDSGMSVGSRVTVAPGKEHDSMTAGATGTIVETNGTAFAIKFDGMEKVHRWYTAKELVPAGGSDDESDPEEKPDPEGAASAAEKSAVGDLFAAWDEKDNAAGAAALKAFLQACGYGE